MLSGGEVVEDGAPAELLATDGALSQFCISSGCEIATDGQKLNVKEKSSDETGEQKPTSSGDEALVQTEELPAGAVPMSILARYIKGMGKFCGLPLFLFILLFVLAQYGNVAFTDRWLAHWVQARSEGTSTSAPSTSIIASPSISIPTNATTTNSTTTNYNNAANFTNVTIYWSITAITTDTNSGASFNDQFYLFVYACSVLSLVVLSLILSCLFAEGAVRSSRNLHSECLQTLLRAPMSFFESTPSGRITSRFSNDLAVVDKQLPHFVEWVIQLAVNAAMACTQIAIMMPLITPVFFVSLPIYVWQVSIMNETNRELRRLANAAMGPVLTTINETCNGRQVLRSMGIEKNFRMRFCKQLDEYSRFNYAALSTLSAGVLIAFWSAFLISSCTASLIVSGVVQVAPSYAALALTYCFNLPAFLNAVSQDGQILLGLLTSLERLLQYGQSGIVPKEAPFFLSGEPAVTGGAAWPPAGAIVFEKVSLVYRPGMPKSVDMLSLSIAAKEKIGVVGRSGAGKSSLMVLLFRLCEATEGRILIDGVDIASVGLKRLRSAIAIVPQDPLLITGNVRLNLDPFHEHTDEDVRRVLKEVKLDPSMIEKSISASTLSHGERQLLTLGRTLLWPSKIRVFDEPTSNIDAATDRVIQQLLRCASAFRDSAQITIAHRLQTVVDCDRIMVMSSGKLVEVGPPRVLLADPNSQLSDLACHAGFDLSQANMMSPKELVVEDIHTDINKPMSNFSAGCQRQFKKVLPVTGADHAMHAPNIITLTTRVSALLFDCGIAGQKGNENLVSRGRRLAAYLGLEFVSVLALVEEAELLLYGYLKTAHTAAAKRSSAEMSIQDLHLSA